VGERATERGTGASYDGPVQVGIDLIEIARVRRALERYPRFVERVFTDEERRYCLARPNPAQHFAARFAGKEAVGKALGCGAEWMWRDIEIAGRPKPSVRLSGKPAAFATRLGAGMIDLSMTHSKDLAAAIAVVQAA
jgi:holo-[acyl-carrier protein] synthase